MDENVQGFGLAVGTCVPFFFFFLFLFAFFFLTLLLACSVCQNGSGLGEVTATLWFSGYHGNRNRIVIARYTVALKTKITAHDNLAVPLLRFCKPCEIYRFFKNLDYRT